METKVLGSTEKEHQPQFVGWGERTLDDPMALWVMQGQSEELGDLRARGWKNRFVGTRRQINNSREGWKNLRRRKEGRKQRVADTAGGLIGTPNPKKIQFTSSKSRKLAAMLVTGEVTNKKWAGSWIKGTLGWMGKKSRSQSWGGT